MAIESLSRVEFDAFRVARNLNVPWFAEEAEWFADEARNTLGVLLHDRVDDDWAYVILGRDEQSRFRAIDLGVSIESREEAREGLVVALAEIEESGDRVFPQGDVSPRKADLFTPVVSPEKLNPSFKLLMEGDGYSPARGIIREIFASFRDPERNFIEQFQTMGYDARIWEFYLYTYLHESGFHVDRSYVAPDFMCTKFGVTVCIEATTVNPTQRVENGSVLSTETDPTSPTEITEKLNDFIPIKFGSVLFSKLQKPYWELNHVAGNPLIFAIEDFHAPRSMVWSGSGLQKYLYGLDHTSSRDEKGKLVITPIPISSHKYGDKEIPSGFFSLPGAENVSAVLFSESGTISKFNRMGHLLGHASPRVRMMRKGTCYNDDPNAAEPLLFQYKVGDPQYPESWGQGLSMFHNPWAANPVSPELFPDIAHHRLLENGLVQSMLPSFHPFGSITHIFTLREDEPDSVD